MRKLRVGNKIFQKNQKKHIKKYVTAFCMCAPSGNQVDGLPLALNSPRPGRACDHNIYKKMYRFDVYFDAEKVVIHRNLDSLDIQASKGAS